jgi:hypothetical protein
MPFEKDPSEIGVLWEHSGAKGQWFSGKINDVSVVVFATNSKSEKAPTHRVLIAKKKEGETSMDQRPMHNANSTPLDDF